MFDVRAAKALQAGEHIVIDAAPGLRLEPDRQAVRWPIRWQRVQKAQHPQPVQRAPQELLGLLGPWTASRRQHLTPAGRSWLRRQRQRAAARQPPLPHHQEAPPALSCAISLPASSPGG